MGRTYKAQVARVLLLALANVPNRNGLLDGYRSTFLGLSLSFHFSNPLRRDLDGGLKITQDAICEALGINDNRILHVQLYKVLDVTQPRMEVSLFRSVP